MYFSSDRHGGTGYSVIRIRISDSLLVCILQTHSPNVILTQYRMNNGTVQYWIQTVTDLISTCPLFDPPAVTCAPKSPVSGLLGVDIRQLETGLRCCENTKLHHNTNMKYRLDNVLSAEVIIIPQLEENFSSY